MALPKIFQTFNSLLGGIVRKRNATIVGPSKQLVGEFPEVDFERLYQYYHHWDQIKTSVDVMHQKFRGSGISITSNNESFNVFIKKWWDVSNAEKKWSQFIYSLLITGSAIMEIQYAPDGRVGSIEQIPMQTIYRIFRDQYANELKLVQIVDGVFKELDPEYFIHHTINNPDRQAFGKSMFNTLASPRPITGTVDPITGEAINPSRNSMSLLDAQAELQNAEIEIKKKMAKPRLIVGANGMPQDQMERIQAEMADPNTDQYIWIFDRQVQSAELQIQSQGKFNEYGDNVDAHIDVGTVFASNVIKNPQGFSYSGGQTPLDVLDQRMLDLQAEFTEVLKDRLLKPLAESWGFKDFDMMEVEITFTPIVKRLTMEDIRGLDPLSVSKKERRELYKKQHIELDDTMWEEEQNEAKQMQSQQNMMSAQAMGMGMPSPQTGDEPAPAMPKGPPSGGDDSKPDSTVGTVKAPTVKPQDDMSKGAPTPKQSTPQPDKKPKGENLHTRLMKEIANEGLSVKETIEAIKAIERIPLPPSATSTSTDLYVGQGIDHEGKPEITDPAIIKAFGLDNESQEEETAPSDPNKMAHAGDQQSLTGADNTSGRFTNSDEEGIPLVDQPLEEDELEVKTEQEYMQHLETDNPADFTQGGTGDDRIDDNSDGSFKDTYDLEGEMDPLEEETSIDEPHMGPNTGQLVKGDLQMSGGTDPIPDTGKGQIIGSNDDDENPIAPDEGFEDDKKLKDKIIDDDEEAEEAIDKTVQQKFPTDTKDKIEGEDPFTSGTSDDPNPYVEPRKQQAKLDDAPLQEEPNDFNNTNEEQPLEDNANDDNKGVQEDIISPDSSDMLGDSGQVRLQLEEEDPELNPDRLEGADGIMDNTGLNMEPEGQMQYQQVSEDDYLKKTQEGEPLEDGMIIKPEDVRQVTPTGTGQDMIETSDMIEDPTQVNPNDADINDPTVSGIDEEEVDPNILHTDPESGILYTDNTDEQGNEIPDLRFDQTADSNEQQPEIEQEYEIVTKEEYEQHVDIGFDNQEQFNAELDNPQLDILETTPEEFKPQEDIFDPVEKGEDGEDKELTDVDENPIEEEPKEKEEKPKKKKEPKDDNSEEPKKSPKKKSKKKDEDKEDPEKSEDEPEQVDEKPSKDDDDKDDINVDDIPETSGSVDDIIKREHELIDDNPEMDEEEIHDILIDEFSADRVEDIEDDKNK